MEDLNYLTNRIDKIGGKCNAKCSENDDVFYSQIEFNYESEKPIVICNCYYESDIILQFFEYDVGGYNKLAYLAYLKNLENQII